MKIFIKYEFINWNKYINLERGNKFAANSLKQKEKQIVKYFAKEKYEGKYPIRITFRPHFKDRRQDLDNFRIKSLLDGLVSAEVIKNDNLNCIQKVVIEPIFENTEGVEVEIEEIK